MRSFLLKFGAGLAGIFLAVAIASGVLTGSANASTDPHSGRGGDTVTVTDNSCDSSAGGLIAVNALNCNDIRVLNDVVDIALLGLIHN